MTTGQRIKKFRKRAGMTQKELGEKLGLSFQSVAQWENNLRNPKEETLQKIANALEISIYELKGLSDAEAFMAELNKGVDLILLEMTIHEKFGISLDVAQKMAEEIAELLQKNLRSDVEAVYQQLLNRLTDEGQQKGMEYLRDLSGNPKYKRSTSTAEASDSLPLAPNE